MEPTRIRLTIPDGVDHAVIMGPSDALLRRVEDVYDVVVTVRGSSISVVGPVEAANNVISVISQLIAMAELGETPSLYDLELLVSQASRNEERDVPMPQEILLTYRDRVIRPKTEGQLRYVQAIRNHTITFGLGPAGTGKTYLAMALAVSALRRREVSRIILARPVVEAGESLGFLPGTLEEKLDPYIRPLYDALFDMCEREKANTLLEQGSIEIAPLAFMRGRTLNDAFVILDEAQNTSPDQMKMFLTRLGFNSKFVITGDATQRDLRGMSGIDEARRVLADVDDIAFVELGADDVVRHTLVASIVEAYDRYRAKQEGASNENTA